MTAGPEPLAEKRHWGRRKIVLSVLGAVGCLIVGAAFYFRGYRSYIDSVAVLPFTNTSADPNSEYLSDGITEGLIDSLSQVPDLRVVSRTSVFHYKGKDTPPRDVARDLNVKAIVSGRVTQRGDTLMVSAELIDAQDDRQIWGEQYSRKLSDVLTLQQEIAGNISEKLRKLTGVEKERITKRSTDNPDAYQAFLKGRYHWDRSSEDDLKQAIHYFEEAVRLDPSYAPAYAGMADAYDELADLTYLAPTEAFPKAKAAALKALEIDPTLSEAHTVLGEISWWYDWDWATAEKEYRRAIELNPSSAVAHLRYAYLLATIFGRFDQATAEGRRAQELEPLSLIMNTYLGYIYTLAHRYDESFPWYQKGHRTRSQQQHRACRTGLDLRIQRNARRGRGGEQQDKQDADSRGRLPDLGGDCLCLCDLREARRSGQNRHSVQGSGQGTLRRRIQHRDNLFRFRRQGRGFLLVEPRYRAALL